MGTEGLGAVLEELKSFLSSIDGDFESASFDEISELQVPDNVTMFLQKTGSVMGSLLGQLKESQLRQMNVDRILKQAENKQKADQEKITQLEGSLSHLNHEISNFKSMHSKDENQASKALMDLEKVQAELSMAQGRLERSEVEKLELVRLLERKQVEMDGINDQLEGLIKKQSQLRQDSHNKDVALEEVRRSLTTAQVDLGVIRQESEQAKKQLEWTRVEFERTGNEFKDYRKHKLEEMSELKSELERVQGVSLALERQIAQLKAAGEEKDGKIEDLLQKVLKSREDAAEKEQSFVDESSTTAKMVHVYKQASEEASARIVELEAQVEEAQQALGSIDDRILEIRTEHEATENQLKAIISDKDALISSLREQVSVSTGSGELSSNAAVAMQTVRSGQSLSQVFSDLAQTRTSLLEATQENERLKVCLRDVCEDIEAKLPGIQADRQENIQLKSTVNGLSERLMSLTKEKERIEAAMKTACEERDRLQKHAKSLEKEVSDLGLQVQTLLLQQDLPELADSDMINSDQVITSRLVPVKNVAELQVRNQELLRVVRELSSRAEVAEAQARELQAGSHEQQLQQALKEIEELREARARQTTMVESLVKQQQQTSTNHASVDLTNDLPTVHEPKTVKDFDHEKFLMSKLEEARQEVISVKSSLAKAQAKADFNHERLELLRSNYDACRQELELTRQTSSEQSKSLNRIQGEMQTMLADVISAKEAARRADSELAIIKNNFASSQAAEKRLSQEKESLMEEKQKLSQLLSGLQAMVSESEASSQGLRERLSSQVEFLERELQTCRQKLEASAESHRLEVSALGRENRELQEKISKLYEEASKTTRPEVSSVATTGSEALERDLEVTRRQLEEFKQRSTANEHSLLELGHQFEEYRQRSNVELEQAQTNLNQAKQDLDELSRQHVEKENLWAAERAQLGERLGELEQLETLMKEQSGMRAEDVARLQTLLLETQSRLEEEMRRSQETHQQLEDVTIRLKEAEGQVHQLRTELDHLRMASEQRESELTERLKDVESERDRAVQSAAELSTAMPLSPVMEESEAITFLRKQKDISQGELQSVQQSNRRLQIQLEQTQALLEEARNRLAEEQSASQWQTNLATEYEQLQAKIAGLTALKEANVELSGTVQMLTERLNQTERQLSDYAKQYEEASRSLREAQAVEGTRAEHIRVLEQDRDTWRSRLEQLMESGDAAQQVKKATEERDKALHKLTLAENKMNQIIQRSLQLKNELEEAKKTRPEELTELQGKLKAAESEIEGQAAQITKFQEAFKKFGVMKDRYKALQETHQALLATKDATATATATAGLEESKRVDELKREHELHKTLLTNQWKVRVAKLQKEIDDLKQQQQQQEERVMEEEAPAKKLRHDMEIEPVAVLPSEPVAEPVTVLISESTSVPTSAPVIEADSPVSESAMTPPLTEEVAPEPEETLQAEEEQEEAEEEEDQEEQEEEQEDESDEEWEETEEAEEEDVQMADAMDTAEDLEMEETPPQPEAETPIQETLEPEPTQVAMETVEETFDVDAFLSEQILASTSTTPTAPVVENKTINLAGVVNVGSPTRPTTSSGPIFVTTTSRTINLPVSTSSATFTATPIPTTTSTSTSTLPTTNRMIDLSKTGKKPLPSLPTATSTITAQAAAARGRGGHHLIRSRPGRKLKRGGSQPPAPQ